MLIINMKLYILILNYYTTINKNMITLKDRLTPDQYSDLINIIKEEHIYHSSQVHVYDVYELFTLVNSCDYINDIIFDKFMNTLKNLFVEAKSCKNNETKNKIVKFIINVLSFILYKARGEFLSMYCIWEIHSLLLRFSINISFVYSQKISRTILEQFAACKGVMMFYDIDNQGNKYCTKIGFNEELKVNYDNIMEKFCTQQGMLSEKVNKEEYEVYYYLLYTKASNTRLVDKRDTFYKVKNTIETLSNKKNKCDVNDIDNAIFNKVTDNKPLESYNGLNIYDAIQMVYKYTDKKTIINCLSNDNVIDVFNNIILSVN